MDVVLPYTIAFCFSGDRVLMLYRAKPPHEGKWNGVGGKLEQGETPLEGIKREILEETGIDPLLAWSMDFRGIVTWTGKKGMNAYVVRFPERIVDWKEKTTAEGLLAWKDLEWVCDINNPDVVSNIPFFLPSMLSDIPPAHHHTVYNGDEFVRVDHFSLES